MASTYTTNLGIEKIGTGEQSGTWGETTNLNFDILDQAINGLVSVTLTTTGSGSPNTLPITDGTLSDGRNAFIEFVDGGDLGATAYVQLTPNDAEKIAYVRNSLSGGQSVILFQGTYNASNDFELANGKDALLFFNGGGSGAVVSVVQANEVRSGSFQIDNIVLDGNSIDVDGDLTIDVSDSDILLKDDGTTFGGFSLGGTDTDNLVIKSGSTPTAALTLHEGNVGFGTQDEASYLIDAQSASAGIQARFISTDASASSGPDLKFYKNSASPADGDVISSFFFNANTDDGAGGVSLSDVNYGSIVFNAIETNETNGEAAGFALNLKRGGTTQQYISIVGGTTGDTDNDSITLSTGGTAAITIDNSQTVTTGADLTVGTNFDVSSGTIKLDGNYPTGTENVALGDTALDSVTTGGDYNTAIGSSALTANTTGVRNTAVGRTALESNISGSYNTGVGMLALNANTASNNTAVGYSALQVNTSGTSNTAVGYDALSTSTTTSNNTAVGYSALGTTTGEKNVAVGNSALLNATTADCNVAIGSSAAACLTTADYNVYIGREAGPNVAASTGGGNVGIGRTALTNITTGVRNVAIGSEAGVSQTDAQANTIIGYCAYNLGTASYNLAIGHGAMSTCAVTGIQNTAIGRFSMNCVTSGCCNVGIGDNTLQQVAGGCFNSALGFATMKCNSGTANTAVGYQALCGLGSAANNSAFGASVLRAVTTGCSNTSLGHASGLCVTAGSNNVFVGRQAGICTTEGGQNVYIGYQAGVCATLQSYNTAVGEGAMFYSCGEANTALGRRALLGKSTGSDPQNSVAVGFEAMYCNASGDNNVAVGYRAGYNIGSGPYNTFVGMCAGYNTTSSACSVAIGYLAARCNNIGLVTAVGMGAACENTSGQIDAFGAFALRNNSTASYNAAFGRAALICNTTGCENVAFGRDALALNETGIRNTAVGAFALTNNTSSNNTAIGLCAMNANTSGSQNVAVGDNALRSNQNGSNNTAVGHAALATPTAAAQNTAVGHSALNDTTTGGNSAGVGYHALRFITSGAQNVAMGRNALCCSTTGDYNTAIGYDSMAQCDITGDYNTAVGSQSGRFVTTGLRNTFLGGFAGAWGDFTQETTIGTGNTFVGYGAVPDSTSTNASIVIAAKLADTTTTSRGSGTGFINPNGGGVYQGNNSSSWSTTSDCRLKKNIVDNCVGLDAVSCICVRNFEYRTEDEITELPSNTVIERSGTQLGVIAQELQQVLPDMVKEETTGVLSVDSDNLQWYMVNAIKELKAEVDTLKAQVAELQNT